MPRSLFLLYKTQLLTYFCNRFDFGPLCRSQPTKNSPTKNSSKSPADILIILRERSHKCQWKHICLAYEKVRCHFKVFSEVKCFCVDFLGYSLNYIQNVVRGDGWKTVWWKLSDTGYCKWKNSAKSNSNCKWSRLI